MRKKRNIRSLLITFLTLLFLTNCNVYAQNRILKGKVTDQMGEPMIGVTVMNVNEQNKSTITDLEGNYSIKIRDNAILKFSYIGFKTKILNVTRERNILNVVLEEETVMLEQTVVVGMNMKRDEKSLSTAFQKMDIESMTESRDVDFLNMLSGKVAGLQVISNGPFGSASVRMRGTNSITGNNEPLFVIDGVPIINESGFDEEDSGIDYGNAANSLNPDAIESIVVLKGANATAIYGSDAANGAIIITTKKGDYQKGLGITYSTNLQFTKLSQYPIYQNVYGVGTNTAFRSGYANLPGKDLDYDPNLPWGINQLTGSGYNQYSWGLPMLGFDVVGRNGYMKTYSPNDGNILNMYEVATTWTNNVSVDKRGENFSSRLTYTNIQADDIMENFNKVNRNLVNFHLGFKPVKFLNIDINASYMHESGHNRGSRNGSDSNPLNIITSMPRDLSLSELIPWKRPDGRPTTYNGFKNPYWLLNEGDNGDKKNSLLANVAVTTEFTKDLRLRLRAAIEQSSKSFWSFANLYSPNDYDGDYREGWETMRNYTYEALLSYNKRWKDCFNLTTSLGTSMQDYNYKSRFVRMPALFQQDIKSLTNSGGYLQTGSIYRAKKKIGIFGTASVGYKDFIYIDLTARNDWSSSLPASKRSYLYYSAGTSFIFTEAFKDLIPKKYLSYAKFRVSYAQVGNDAGFDQLLSSYKYGRNYLGSMSYYESDNNRRNPKLKPERTTSVETGLDLRFLDNRITLDFTYYNKITRDQIVGAELDGFSGYTSEVVNAGKIRNWGTEITLGVVPVRTKSKWEWKVDFNYANNKSKVLSLTNDVEYMSIKGARVAEIRLVVGQPFGSIYTSGRETNELGQVYVDANGSPYEQKGFFLGNVSPKWIGGLRNTVKWRDFSASMLLDIKVGGHIWSGTAFQGAQNGATVESLQGRDAYLFSNIILRENNEERKGLLNSSHSNSTNNVIYGDNRIKGSYIPNAVFKSDGTSALVYINPMNYWCHDPGRGALFIYDASFIKLREVSIGYNVPTKYLKKIGGFLQSARLSAVGRNLAILYQKTPKGIDPEATTTLGSGLGLENGFSLPSSSYGFNLKITF
ncbi:SusC/RagA family TonB-linked outer membrane protein [Bacteroides sp. 1001136B_160425_E2]|uniref:SusC/RagA family TonB-linked outer membrane protein n=1 Tax=Bacteroides sp. 1001136B_160425_E2 TaxID=2787083 RepID=UPI00189F3736|nr:SusC/RagA family TonB-linked outer membrane protein [Bacteroides sp. 1001136B_160425_E2]